MGSANIPPARPIACRTSSAIRSHLMSISLSPLKRLAQRGWIPLLALFVLLTGIVLFIRIADSVIEGRSQKLDERIVRSFRLPDHPETPIGPAWLANAGRDITSLGGPAV